MSYILDALRRAEADRERGNVPGLHAQAVGPVGTASDRPSADRARWTLPVVVGLVAAVALLAWRPWAVDLPSSAAGSGAGVAPVGNAPATVSPTPTPAASVSAPVAVPAPSLRTAAVPPRRAVAPVPPATVAKKRPAAAASDAEASVASASARSAASEAKIHAMAELPPDVRQQLPQVAIGGSIYSTSPASRFVIVNGQLFHEGDTLAPGLVLEQIRLKSVVLAFRGYRYAMTF